MRGERAIAAMLGVNRLTVRRYRALLGIPARPPGRRRGTALSPPRAQYRPPMPYDLFLAVLDQQRHGRTV